MSMGDTFQAALPPPPDAAGSDTQARYAFQHHCTARYAIALLTNDQIACLICEWHEDYVVVFRSGTLCLVSVKHREPSQDTWTKRQLCDDGGLSHLFQRWRSTGGVARCLLQTNAGLRQGGDEPGGLAEACHSRDRTRLASWPPRLLKFLGDSNGPDEVVRFLMALSVESGLPGRDHIRAANLQDLMRPALPALGWSVAEAEQCYDAIVFLIATANRADAPPGQMLRGLGDIDRLVSDKQTSAELQRRTVDRDRLLITIAREREPLVGLLESGPESAAMTTTIMAKKLIRGGLGPTAVESARRLRSAWLAVRNRWSNELPGGNLELDDSKTRVLHIVQQAETASLGQSEPYGLAMQRDLEQRLRVGMLGRAPLIPVSDHHLLGLAYELTDECLAWWSAHFEVGGS